MTFRIYQLGCKVNQYESQLMLEQLEAAGFSRANGKPADIYIINTCTVTKAADSSSRGFLRRALRENPKARIIAAGCYAEKNADDILAICKDAIIVKNKQKANIIDFIGHPVGGGTRPARASIISAFFGHNRAFVKIQDGCRNSCSYCKVPLVRGRCVSRPNKEVINEVKLLAANNFKEVVLCGICLGAYRDLPGLLDKLEGINGLRRIRLSSIEPLYVTSNLIERFAFSGKLCRHLHMPLQSGDDKVLKLMNRKYTACGFIKLIENIRKKIPKIAISTDVLAGFPTEGQEEFDSTLKVMKIIKPMRVHAFSYSQREGTRAFYLGEQVKKQVIQERVRIIRQLADRFAIYYKKKFLNRSVEALVEDSPDKETGLNTGYTDTYIKVLFKAHQGLINEIVNVRINRITADNAFAEVINEAG